MQGTVSGCAVQLVRWHQTEAVRAPIEQVYTKRLCDGRVTILSFAGGVLNLSVGYCLTSMSVLFQNNRNLDQTHEKGVLLELMSQSPPIG